MIDVTLMASILDSLKDPLVFAGTDHIIRYMNRAAIAHYEDGENLIGRSIMDCHNAQSQAMILEILQAFALLACLITLFAHEFLWLVVLAE